MAFLFKKEKAFTLIELMTTTLIMAIIICAAIPFVIKKDIQKRAVAGHIGLFECYYDSSGQLTQHIRTKDGIDLPETHPSGSCSFNPNADYTKGAKNFQIVAIGGGGAGGTYNTHDSDAKLTAFLNKGVSENDTLDSEHIKYLTDHGRLKFGTLSNTGGVNAWYWNGEQEKYKTLDTGECEEYGWEYHSGSKADIRACLTDICHSAGGTYYHRADGCLYHTNHYYDFCRPRYLTPFSNNSSKCYSQKRVCKKYKTQTIRTNNSTADYISVYNIGPRLCSLNSTDLMTKNLPEDDIFQAIYKYFAVAGSYTNGDIVYDIKAPSGLSSCACLNDAIDTNKQYPSCMAGSIKPSVAGTAGSAYTYSTYSGVLRAAYMGNEFLTNDGSRDESKSSGLLPNHCVDDLKLRDTAFGCGNGNRGFNKECSGESLRSGYERNFPEIYYWGNGYDRNKKATNWYEEIDMDYTNREGDLRDYGGDVHFRLVAHNNEKGHAIVPRGKHGETTFIASSSPVNSNFKGFINGQQKFYSAGSVASACDSPDNKYSVTESKTIFEVKASCSDSCTYTGTCGTGSNAHSCTKTKSCSDTGYSSPYYPSQTKAHAYTYSTNNCTCSCEKYDNVASSYTDSAGTCEHLNCCNNYAQGSKKYTIRYNTGEKGSSVTSRSKELNCGSHLYIYRQIKGVPYERVFVASAGQNGAVKQAAYPKIDEELALIPGAGGQVGGDDKANGKVTIIKNKSGKVILSAQGGTKGASDKLNDTWVGPCMLFSHRGNFDLENPGCMARHDIMRKPTYNALLMANAQYLKSVNLSTSGDTLMPGLGGDGAYANVFPDRFLLSKAIREQIKLETTYIGPDQKEPWSKTEGKYTVIGLDAITRAEFIGDDSYANEYKRRYDLLQTAASSFISDTQRDGRVPNFTKATNGNNGAIVIIW